MATQTITHSDDNYVDRTITDKQLAYSDGPSRAFKIAGNKLGATGTAYADGDLIGNLLKLSDAVRDTNGHITLMAIVMQDKSKQNGKIEVIFFDAEPSNTTFTDDAMLAIDNNDIEKIIGQAIIESDKYQSYSNSSAGTKANIGLPLKGDSGNDLWVCFVSRDTKTYIADELSSIISFYG